MKLLIATTKPLNGEHPGVHLELPATDEALLDAAISMGLPDLKSGCKIIGFPEDEYHGMLSNMPYKCNLHEVNLLAHKLETFEPELRQTYLSYVADIPKASLDILINSAYDFASGEQKIWRDISDTHELGLRYAQEEYRNLPEIIFGNLDFDGIGADLEHKHGQFADDSFVFLSDADNQYTGDNLEELLCELREQEQQQTNGLTMGGM